MLANITLLHYAFAWLGVMVIVFLLGILVTIIVEVLAMLLNFKAKTLQTAILELLQFDEVLNGQFFRHPRFRQLAGNDKKAADAPAYLPADTFADIFLEILQLRGLNDKSPDAVLSDVKPLDTFLKNKFEEYKSDNEAFRGFLERWFSEKMDLASEKFRKRAILRLVVVSLFVVVVFNANVISLYHSIIASTIAFETAPLTTVTEATDNLEKLVRIDPSLQQSDSLKMISRKILQTLDQSVSEGKRVGEERQDGIEHWLRNADQPFSWWVKWLFNTIVTALVVAYCAQFVYGLVKRIFKWRR